MTRAVAQEALDAAGVAAARPRGDRHHEPARDRRLLGPSDRASRSTARSCGRTAARPRAASSFGAEGHEEPIRERTGLVIDPYFSGTKIEWMLENVDGPRDEREAGEVRSARSTPGSPSS